MMSTKHLQLRRLFAIRKVGTSLLLSIVLAACSSSDPAAPEEIPIGSPPPVSNGAPLISGSPPNNVTVGVEYSFTPQASDPDGDTLNFSANNVPSWLTIDSTSGHVSGTPQAGSEGIYDNIEIVASDGQLSATLPVFSIMVDAAATANQPPVISGTPSSAASIGNSYSFTPNGSDPDGDVLTFTIQNTPDWAEFDSADGRLSGTPQTGNEGTYTNIIIAVSDGASNVSLGSFDIIVSAAATIAPLAAIPDIPFDYAQAPGPVTRSGPLPASLGAGEVLAFTGQSTTTKQNALSCSGTENNPAFIIGGTLSGANHIFSVSGSWCIFVDTVFDNISLRVVAGDHHVFRNITVANSENKNGASFGGSNIVIVDSEIHHNQGDDRHGIHVQAGTDSIWILRNYVHHNGGDGFQACHGCSANPPRNVYIGQNLFHSDRENAVDFKYIENVIVEGNTIHSLVSAPRDELWCFDDDSSCGVFSSGSDGTAIVIGSDGGPTNVLVIGNEIYGTVNAVRIEEGVEIRVEDNNFHDVSGRCLQLDKTGFNTVYSGNACTNSGRGIFQNFRENFSLTVDNNTFDNVTGPSVEYESRDVGDVSTLTDNSFRGSGPVVYGNTSASTEAMINALPNSSDNRVE